MNPRIAIVTPGTFAIPSPKSSSVETIVERLTDTLRNDVDFTVFGKKTKDLAKIEKRRNITYIRFNNRYISRVIEVLKKQDPHIIQIENRPKYITLTRKVFPHTQIWLSLHSTKFISKSQISRNELIKALSLTDKVVVNSHFLKKYLKKMTNINESKIFVNHLGVDINQFQSKWHFNKSENIKKQLNVEGRIVLLFVGRLRRIKGVEGLLSVLPLLTKKYPNILLLIVGSACYGSGRNTRYVICLHEKAEHLSDHVRFIPFIPHDQIQKWFQAADITLVPSLGKEAFGLVNIEAMACGVPVIASKTGGMPEIIEHGKTGFLVNLNNIETELTAYIDQLLSNPDLLKKMGENCVISVMEHFTWEKSARRLLREYLKIFD